MFKRYELNSDPDDRDLQLYDTEEVDALLARLDAAFGEIVQHATRRAYMSDCLAEFNEVQKEASRLWEQAKEGGE